MKLLPRGNARAGWPPGWAAPTLILLVAFGLRLLRLGDANLWWDEALAVWGVRKGLLGVTLWTAGDVHPPLYFWSLWAWVQAVGESEFAMRVLSVAYGVLTVAVIYRFGCMLAGRGVGSLGALLISLSRFHVWWSQEMRMYVLAGLLGMLSLYLFIRWLRSVQSSSSGNLLALYTLASIGALYTILLMGAVVLVENIVVLMALVWPRGAGRRPPLLPWVGGQLAILAALGGWMALAWGRMHSWSAATPISPLFLTHLYATLLTTGVSVNIGRYLWAAAIPWAILAFGGALGFLSWRRRPHDERRASEFLEILTLALAVLLPAGAIYYATMPRSLFYAPQVEARYFLPFAPAFWLLLAWSIVRIGKNWRTAGLGCGALVVALWSAFLPGYYRGRYLRDELQTMVRTIISQAEPADVVLLDSGSRYPLFLYDYDRFPSDVRRPPMIGVPPGGGHLEQDKLDRALAPLVEPYRRIWLAEVEANLSDPQHLAARWLREHYQQVLALRYGHNALYLYDPEGRAPTLATNGYPPQYRLEGAVGQGGDLLGWELPVQEYTAGDTAHISLLWKRMPEGPALLALRNRRGQVLAQYRLGPATGDGPLRQQYDLPIFASTPAGEYQIVLSPAAGPGLVLGALRVAHTEALPRVGPPEVPLNARVSASTGEEVALVGYSLRDARGKKLQRIAPGEGLVLDLYWRTERKLEREYTVFTHLLGEAHNPRTQGPVWAQHDSFPANNGYPTSQWLEGDIIVDRHVLVVDEQAPEGRYRLEVGMYTVEDGKRLAVRSQQGEPLGDQLLLDTPVSVEKRR